MKVKSLVYSLDNGYVRALRNLDESVAALGNIKIHFCTDTQYHMPEGVPNTPLSTTRELLVRVIVYDKA